MESSSAISGIAFLAMMPLRCSLLFSLLGGVKYISTRRMGPHFNCHNRPIKVRDSPRAAAARLGW